MTIVGLVVALCAMAIAGCGDGGGGSKATPAGGASVAATGTAKTLPANAQAKDLLPDLAAQGYKLVQQEADPGAKALGQDAHRALYQKNTSQEAALVYILVLPNEDAAKKDFPVRSAALKNPPPEFVGSAATYNESQPPAAGDERKGYVTASADAQGNKVWNDIYRFGRVVAIVQVLGPATGEQLPAREAIAKAIAAKVS